MRVVLCLAVALAAADALDALDDLDARGPTRAAAVGCFYVWQPNLRYRSGGALVMHQLAFPGASQPLARVFSSSQQTHDGAQVCACACVYGQPCKFILLRCCVEIANGILYHGRE